MNIKVFEFDAYNTRATKDKVPGELAAFGRLWKNHMKPISKTKMPTSFSGCSHIIR